MLLYYDDDGKLVTVSPHGEIPRQGGALKLSVLMNKNFNAANRLMVARFKTASMISFSADYPMTNKGVLLFKKLPGESIGSLIDGEEYLWFEVDLTNTLANKESGKLKITFTIWKNDGQEPPQLIPSETIVLGMATIYVEETLGLAPYSGVGMTYTEYQALMAELNVIKNAGVVYRVKGSASVTTLNDLEKTLLMNGYVYNLNNSGFLYNSNGTSTVVNAGDNVALIYDSETDYHWDKLTGIVDTSAFATRTQSDEKYVWQSSFINENELDIICN